MARNARSNKLTRRQKRKARQNGLTSLFRFEPGCNSGVSGGGGTLGLPRSLEPHPELYILIKQQVVSMRSKASCRSPLLLSDPKIRSYPTRFRVRLGAPSSDRLPATASSIASPTCSYTPETVTPIRTERFTSIN